MKLLNSFMATTVLVSGIVLGTMTPSEACIASKANASVENGFQSLISGLKNSDIKQAGLMGAGILFVSGVTTAGILFNRRQKTEESWEVAEFPIAVPPEALKSLEMAELEAEESLTSVR